MNDQTKRLVVKNYITQQQISLNVKEDLKIGELVEAIEQIANNDNKTSGEFHQNYYFSKALNKNVQLEDTVGLILKGITFDEIEIGKRFSQSQSELQSITILIKIQSYLGKPIKQQKLEMSRFDKISQIEDVILKELKIEREAFKIQFQVKGQICQPKQSLADLNLIDNDEIIVKVPIKLNIQLQEGSQFLRFSQYFAPQDSLQDVINFILQRFSILTEQVGLALTYENQLYKPNQFNSTLSDLKLDYEALLIVKLRYSGGFQRKQNQN
ncbi:unnamed protein product (macronuclear) [Paramecium tetraurelia]|uniref:Ubiquitin-like domain-containing protein n=1 Tax=Paramecium tetraurelia TaxID=5888 RepID=A0CP92_PARTE|nr:uncharacterized protein GSPATT00009000001 [Paramecium tetraurelia]CAK72609.1 unnamed protein product [Paramecium tetraurelia]|eukprot:XP_001440006.1 hypothetical protein (macronuclear) [Paramecium tetraurelia strain d4-2]